MKESLQDTQPVGVLVDCCKTLDQVSVPFGSALSHHRWHKVNDSMQKTTKSQVGTSQYLDPPWGRCFLLLRLMQ